MSTAAASSLNPLAVEPAGRPLDPAVVAIAEQLGRESGAVAVLFYGSNLRTGSLEGVLDFYVLLPGPREKGLWPLVSYREWERGGHTLRAKIATMQLATFAEAAAGRTLDTTIWSRFVQPSALAWVCGASEAATVQEALRAAARTAAWLAVALGPRSGTEEDYWRALFRATYRAELRVEVAGRERSILSANPAHFRGLLARALAEEGIACQQQGSVLVPQLEEQERRRILRWWERRRRMGKPLNILRLLRAAATFEGAARYAAWKIERHTGIAVELTPWSERHPILAAPGVLWRLSGRRRMSADARDQ
jgi:hypothetical protein